MRGWVGGGRWGWAPVLYFVMFGWVAGAVLLACACGWGALFEESAGWPLRIFSDATKIKQCLSKHMPSSPIAFRCSFAYIGHEQRNVTHGSGRTIGLWMDVFSAYIRSAPEKKCVPPSSHDPLCPMRTANFHTDKANYTWMGG